MRRKFRLSKAAKADLDDIWEYIALNGSVEAATRLVDSIAGAFPLLAKNPAAGQSCSEFGQGTRRFPVASYIIYYRRGKGGIEIARILHAKREQETAWVE